MSRYHVCFSGNLACSGCNPCPACLDQVRSRVLPTAMISGGFNQSPEQAGAFFQGFAAGWQQLQQAMVHDPAVSQHLRLIDVAEIIEQLRPVSAPLHEVARQQAPQQPQEPNMMPPQGPAPQPPPTPRYAYQQTPAGYPGHPSIGYPGHPGMYGPPGPGYGPPGQMSEPQRGTFVPVAQPVYEPVIVEPEEKQRDPEEQRLLAEKERMRNLTKPMDAEEIAAAASPVQQDGRAVLGSVMMPGFQPRAPVVREEEQQESNGILKDTPKEG